MPTVTIPEGYSSFLTLRQTEYAIKKVKDFFEKLTPLYEYFNQFKV